MVKLQELLMLTRIMSDRLRDSKPDEKLILRCLEPVWPYIYPYGTISYAKKNVTKSSAEIDHLKTQKMLRALNGTHRKWRSFIIGLCYTYRDRHSPKRNRTRLLQKTIHLEETVPSRQMENLAEQFRQQALQYDRVVKETASVLIDPAEAAEKLRLAKTLCNEENVPRFLLISRKLDCDKLLDLVSPEILEKVKQRYDKPNILTLSFDLLQEYISLNDGLWKQFKALLAGTSKYH